MVALIFSYWAMFLLLKAIINSSLGLLRMHWRYKKVLTYRKRGIWNGEWEVRPGETLQAPKGLLY